KFDIIQASCIATWSATSAGAFSLAENSLYTVEGWRIFFDHLEPDGVLSFNRWYAPDYPAQLMRMATIASVLLKERGVKDPAKHIAVVRNPIIFTGGEIGQKVATNFPSGTIIVSKSPFSEATLKRLRDAAKKLAFKVEFDPGGYRNVLFEKVIKNAGDKAFHASTQLDLTPPTDDRPFFFYMLRLKDVFSGKHLKFQEQRFTLEGITILGILLIVSIVLCILFIVLPLFIIRKRVPLPAGSALFGIAFFGAIGLGYILIEIGQLQRLIIFLGHPIYSMTVVLFSMLFASGIGSAASGYFLKKRQPTPSMIAIVMGLLLVVLIFVTFYQTSIISGFVLGSIGTRIAISLLFLLPMGFLMGLPFPLGMKLAAARSPEHTPWFWAVNGAASVVASVLSACISITYGFTFTLTLGLICYVVAVIFLIILSAGAGGRGGEGAIKS
ncbi:MAG: hypothetical protein V3T30_05755, partial [Thermodesulfobacteriota bacterium]